MVSLSTITSLLITFGPILLPKLLNYYRGLRASTASQSQPIRPVPPKPQSALNILFTSSLFFLLLSTPYFSPPNIFHLTSSRFMTPNDVLFNRLSTLRPLTPLDEALRDRLKSIDSRFLYFKYGPDAIAYCSFCDAEEPSYYLMYSLPSLLLPHLIHMIILGLATSLPFSGREGSRWRTFFTIVGLVLAAGDLFYVMSYDHATNSAAMRGTVTDIYPFFWRIHSIRYMILAITDIAVAYILYLSSTNRLFVVPPALAERLESSTSTLEVALRKLHAVGITRNVIARDKVLRKREEAYWEQERDVMTQVFEDRDVLDGVNKAIAEGRVDLTKVEDEAGKYAHLVTDGLAESAAG
ncbi:MAG: hypothetical protein M1834_004518 [Cirrosporium novae-zelandiae]|nr:MAG: hypothetical protein M1834_004518 [Cirrosporium novae-zelandiae]